MITFGEIRALVQQPRSPARDLALCEVLRDTPRQRLREQGIEEYVMSALLAGMDLQRYGTQRGDLYRALRRGELCGAARELVLDLRGYKRPSNRIFDRVLERVHQRPIAHLLLDNTMCGADWVMRLLRLADWSELRWLSVRGCGLQGTLDVVLGALPEGIVALMCAGNALQDVDIQALAAHAERLCGLRWLELTGSVAEHDAFEVLIERAAEVKMRLVGLDVTGVEYFDDDHLAAMMSRGLCEDLCSWRGQESGVSEYGLPALLWGLPPGQLEVIAFGDGRSERTHFMDEDATLELLEIPAFEHVYALEWAYSATPAALIKTRPEGVMLAALVEKPWFERLERLGLRSFDLNEVCVAQVFDVAVNVRELSLTQLWAEFEVRGTETTRGRRAIDFVGESLERAFEPGRELVELQVGLLDDAQMVSTHQWSGWDEDWAGFLGGEPDGGSSFRRQIVGKLVEGLPCHRLERMILEGPEIFDLWLDAFYVRPLYRVEHCLFVHAGALPSHSMSRSRSMDLFKHCSCVETDEEGWSSWALEGMRDLLTHKRMTRALRESSTFQD